MTYKLLSFSLLIVVLFCTSCKKLLTFNVDYTTYVSIPPQTIINSPFSFFSPEVETNSSAKFESEGTNTENVKTIYLTQLKLSISSPQDANFDFISEIQIFIKAPDLEEKLIAEKKSIPKEQLTTLYCEVKGVELKEYISKEYFELRIRTVSDQPSTQEITIKADQIYSVEAKLK